MSVIYENKRNEMIHSAFSDFGFNVANFGMHSFRSGEATAAAQNDTPDRLFKILCRWKSDKAKDGYVLETLQKRLSVSQNLGTV